jgi:uncharacterized protein (TIGR02597 family)
LVWTSIASVGADVTNAVVALSGAGEFPYFRVRAVNSTQMIESEYSNVISVEGTDPTASDTDGDGMLDGFEVASGLDPYLDDAYEDADGDRYPNIFEYARGSDVGDPGSTPAADYIADGNNPPSGNSFSTIQGALDQVAGNHRIVQVREGIYSGSGNVNLTVSATHSLLLIGEKGAAGTILDGGGTARLLTTQGQTVVDGFTFRNGMGGEGGALYAGGSNLLVVNCVFTGNQAVQNGGALYQAAGSTMVIHSTLLNNLAGAEGAAVYVDGGYLGIAKSILWNSGTGAEVAVSGTGAEVEVTESIVRGGHAGMGNLAGNPLAGPGGHLTVGSPAIDSGGILQTALLDMDGEERPAGTTTDIGADEWVDTDSDGLPDWWEMDVLGSLTATGSDDPDGDGLTNVQEYEGSSDPQNYYSQGPELISPMLSIVSGNNQSGEPSTFADEPFVVEVRSGTSVLANAPVTFTVTGSAGGGITTESGGLHPVSTLSVVTGTDGRARAYFEYPATFAASSTVVAFAGSGTSASQVSFQADTSLIPQSGLALWLKADAGVTTGTSNKVSAWADQSGFHNDAAQSLSNRQPILVASAINGHPAVRFSGGQGMAIADEASLRPEHLTVFAVLKQRGFSAYQRLLCRTYYAGSTWTEPFFSYAVGTIGQNASQFPRVSVATGGVFRSVVGEAEYDADKVHLLGWRYDGSSESVFREGLMVASGSASGSINYAATTAVTLGMRSSTITSEFLQGDLAELLFYQRSISPAEQQQVEAYLAQKYGLNIEDSDLDGMPNAYELVHGFDPFVNDSAGDLDEDGWTNGQEYAEGSNPNEYYSQAGGIIIPSIRIISGDQQSGGNSLLAPAPLVVEVADGEDVLANAPIIVEVSGSAGGGLAASPSAAAMVSSLNIKTGPDGRARVYLQFPSDFPSEAAIRVATPGGSSEVWAQMTAVESAIPETGLSLWLRSDKGVVKGGDGRVSAWDDQSGEANHATAGTEIRKPLFVEESINGKSALRFSGTQCLSIADSASMRPQFFTVLAVVKQQSAVSYQRLICRPYHTGYTWSEPYASYACSTIGETSWQSPRSSVATGGGFQSVNGQGGLVLNTPRLLGWKYDGTSQTVYHGGQLAGSGTASGPIVYGATTAVAIGARSAAGPVDFLRGEVAEILFYGRALDAEEQRRAEAYLAQKYRMAEYDSDGDGLSDGYEATHGLNPLVSDSEMDHDGDGLTNLQEYQAGSDPGDYYNGQTPILSIAGGNNQSGPAGQLLPVPLTVAVTNESGVAFANAPLRFAVTGSDGRLAIAGATQDLDKIKEIRTGPDGRASVLLAPGGPVGTISQVQVMTGREEEPVAVLFEATVTEGSQQSPVIQFSGGYQLTSVSVGESASFAVTVVDPGNRAERVELYAGSVKVAESLAAPFTTSWTPSEPGRIAMTVRVFDAVGQASSDSKMLSVNGAQSEAEAYSPAAGGMAVSFPADSDTVTSLPFQRPAIFAGRIKSVAGDVIEAETAGSWAPGRFGPGETHYFIQITSGSREGEEFPVVGNTSTTVQAQGLGGEGGPEPGAGFQILPAWKANDAVPAELFSAGSENGVVEIKFPDLGGDGIDRPYAKTLQWSAAGWLEAAVANPLVPKSWFVLRNQSSTGVTWAPVGDVAHSSVRLPVGRESTEEQDTPLTFTRPGVFTPQAAGLMSGGVLPESAQIGSPGHVILGFSSRSGPVGRTPDVSLYRFRGHLYRMGSEASEGDLAGQPILEGAGGWILRRTGPPDVLLNHAANVTP